MASEFQRYLKIYSALIGLMPRLPKPTDEYFKKIEVSFNQGRFLSILHIIAVVVLWLLTYSNVESSLHWANDADWHIYLFGILYLAFLHFIVLCPALTLVCVFISKSNKSSPCP
jgi:hypothetical protein